MPTGREVMVTSEEEHKELGMKAELFEIMADEHVTGGKKVASKDRGAAGA